MKKSLHPTEYRLVVFLDEAAGFSFLTRSTVAATETIKWEDGQEYPLVKIHISSASHPFFTGEEKIIDTEGRVDRFAARMKAAAAHKEKLAKKTQKTVSKASKNVAKEVKKAASEVADSLNDAAGEIAKTVAKAEKKVAKEVEKAKDEVKKTT